MKLQVGDVFRYPANHQPVPAEIGGRPNYFAVTLLPAGKRAAMPRGITSISPVKTVDGKRRPVVLIRSTPRLAGSRRSPWKDFIDPDRGHVRYFGDNKPLKSGQLRPADQAPGNIVLEDERKKHSAPEFALRTMAAPLVFFEAVGDENQSTGLVAFRGFGVVERVELVTQWDPASERSFSNLMYDFAVLSLKEEGEIFDWAWIRARADPSLDNVTCLSLAPRSWQAWIAAGHDALEALRRRVVKPNLTKVSDQIPKPGSREAKTLRLVYDFFSATSKHAFEALAEVVVDEILAKSGEYHLGWITAPSGDRGADFYGRLDVGSGRAMAKLVVLGQAKCERPDKAAGGVAIARTAARLRRGWLGAFVTTGYYSTQVQEEVAEDEYPILMVNGLEVADSVHRILARRGLRVTDASVRRFLSDILASYPARIHRRHPSELLIEGA